MRKALIGFLLAATAATPFAAQAQETDDDARRERAMQRYERLEQRNQQRWEQRQERQEARQPQVQEQRREAVQAEQESRREWRNEQRQDRQEWRNERREDRRNDRVGGGAEGGSIWRGDPNDPDMERHRRRYERLGRENQREWRQDQREERREWRRDRRGDRRWDRDWRRDHRYDWQGWRYTNRNLYRLPPYYAPYRGHRYSRFSIGLMLGQPFYHQRYWISDPWRYRLPHAGPGFAWVRYYDDVLLVDTWTGEVVDVIYDFFW